jgi:hypothetical protein
MAGMKVKPMSERPIWFLPLMGLLLPVGVGGIFLCIQWISWERKAQINKIAQERSGVVSPERSPVTTGAVPRSISNPEPGRYQGLNAMRQPEPPLSKVLAQIAATPRVQGASSDTFGLSADDLSSYKFQIESLETISASRREFAQRQANDYGFVDEAIKTAASASEQLGMVRCLKNQMQQGVPFYEGKATCGAAAKADP